jgi:hypothetical protein
MAESVRIGRNGMTALHQHAAREGDLLTWTIYDHPSDFPHAYVARPHSARLANPLTVHFEHSQLEFVRAALAHMGLTCIPRAEGDDPAIVETWI